MHQLFLSNVAAITGQLSMPTKIVIAAQIEELLMIFSLHHRSAELTSLSLTVSARIIWFAIAQFQMPLTDSIMTFLLTATTLIAVVLDVQVPLSRNANAVWGKLMSLPPPSAPSTLTLSDALAKHLLEIIAATAPQVQSTAL